MAAITRSGQVSPAKAKTRHNGRPICGCRTSRNEVRCSPDCTARESAAVALSRIVATEVRTEFAPDSPLEGDGFEPSVPVAREPVYIVEGELRDRRGSQIIFAGVPMVRIHLPPATSLLRTRLHLLYQETNTYGSHSTPNAPLDVVVGKVLAQLPLKRSDLLRAEARFARPSRLLRPPQPP